MKVKVKVAQSCPTLCDPMDYTVHGILQARILEWVAFPFFRGSSQPRDQTQFSRIAGRFFTSWATREAQMIEGSSQDKAPDTFPSVLLVSCQTPHTALSKFTAIHRHHCNLCCRTVRQDWWFYFCKFIRIHSSFDPHLLINSSCLFQLLCIVGLGICQLTIFS